ncbi:MAG: J domain-containing protein [Acidimicrobiales bacterium]
MDHYDALGVAPEAEAGEIRRAYLQAARRHHPDFHADADPATRAANAARMQLLNQAWEVLGDPGARARYDCERLVAEDPGVARRAAREPGMPAGKGWTPRAGDDGWMQDFDAWASERDELAPDAPPSARRGLALVAPVVLFAAAGASLFLGALYSARPMIAVAAILLVLSAGLFVLLPLFEMARGRRR